MSKQIISHKAEQFTESVIREMTRQANLYGAINLSQGFPDFSAPEEIKLAACDAIMADVNPQIDCAHLQCERPAAIQARKVGPSCGWRLVTVDGQYCE